MEAVLGTSMKANEELFRKILGGDGKMNKDLKEFFDDFLSVGIGLGIEMSVSRPPSRPCVMTERPSPKSRRGS